MTETELLLMYKDKYHFIQKLDLILTTPIPTGFSVSSIDYELWSKVVEDRTCYQEVLLITFIGGSILPISINGNSNPCNLQVLSENINGGDYSFFPTYQKIKETWKPVDLN